MQQLEWFATRVIRDRAYVLRYLEVEGVQISRISDIPTLVFVHCPKGQILQLRGELWDRVLFYRKAGSREPQAIPDNVMQTFLIMSPYHNEPVFYMAVDDPNFFCGRRKRVVKGVFAGCEGVVKRIKGERRLIVKVSDRAAIVTPYIPQEFMEDAE